MVFLVSHFSPNLHRLCDYFLFLSRSEVMLRLISVLHLVCIVEICLTVLPVLCVGESGGDGEDRVMPS